MTCVRVRISVLAGMGVGIWMSVKIRIAASVRIAVHAWVNMGVSIPVKVRISVQVRIDPHVVSIVVRVSVICGHLAGGGRFHGRNTR